MPERTWLDATFSLSNYISKFRIYQGISNIFQRFFHYVLVLCKSFYVHSDNRSTFYAQHLSIISSQSQ